MAYKKIKGLYYIKDLRSDNIIYIGQTVDFGQRKYRHFWDTVQPVDKYMYEEGRDNFEIKIFEDIDVENFTEDDLRKKEDELIVFYDTKNNGFNKQRSGHIIENIDYEKQRHKEYYINNKDTLLDKNKQWQKDHKEERRNYSREYKQRNKDHINKLQMINYYKRMYGNYYKIMCEKHGITL